MDFLISLAHFCEVHGPTSILCTQVLPISCLACFPPDHAYTTSTIASASGPAAVAQPRGDDTTTTANTPPRSSGPADYFEKPSSPKRSNSEPHSRTPSFSRRSHGPPASQRSGLHEQHLQHQSIQANAHGAASDILSPLESPRSPSYQALPYSSSLGSSEAAARYGGAVGGVPPSSDTCLNCSLSIPKSVSEKLPEGAPGSPTSDGRGKNGSPVLRTREAFVARGSGCVAADLSRLEEKPASEWRRSSKKKAHQHQHQHPHHHRDVAAHPTPGTSVGEHDDMVVVVAGVSSASSSADDSPRSCASSMHTPDVSRTSTFATSFPSTPPSTPPTHAHTLTYLSTRQPSSLDAHSLLRRSCIRTLSCEQLPRTHSGPLFFGDDRSGYTISLVFRLPDPCARGRVRRYAFIAWAGRDERRAARAYKDVLHVFAGMAARIVDMVEKREAVPCGGGGGYGGGGTSSSISSRESVPVSSFLSGRSVDPDGYPRRPEVRAKGLAELVGKEDIFVDMHAAFVHLLAQLGRNLGGWPMGMIVDSGIRGEVGETAAVAGGGDVRHRDGSVGTAHKSAGNAHESAGNNAQDEAVVHGKHHGSNHRNTRTAEVVTTTALPVRTSNKNTTGTTADLRPTPPGAKSATSTSTTGIAEMETHASSSSSSSSSASTTPTATATTTATAAAGSSSSSATATATAKGSNKGMNLDARSPSPLETVSRRQIAV